MANNSRELAQSLRQLADRLEQNKPFIVPIHNQLYMRFFGTADKESFLAAVRSIGGKKETNDYNYELLQTIGPMTIRMAIERSVVCTLVEPAKPAVYDCPSLLSGDEEQEIGYAAV